MHKQYTQENTVKGTFRRVKIADLKKRPLRSSYGSEDDLKSLGRSWLKRAVHPIVCRPDLTVGDGHRRLEGLALLGEIEATVFVTDANLTDDDLTELGLMTAVHRADLSAYDQAVAVRDWLARGGGTAKELADKLDRDPSTILRLNSLWKTTPATIRAATEGKIGSKCWYSISLLPECDRDGLLALHLSGTSASQIEVLSKKQRAPKPTADTVKQARVVCPLPTGSRVVVSGEAIDMDTLIEMLQGLLASARSANRDGLDVRTFARVLSDKAKAG